MTRLAPRVPVAIGVAACAAAFGCGWETIGWVIVGGASLALWLIEDFRA